MGECCHFHLAPALLEGPNGPPWHLPGAIETFKGNRKDLRYESGLRVGRWTASLNVHPVDGFGLTKCGQRHFSEKLNERQL